MFAKASKQMECEICEMATTYLEEKLTSSNTEADISIELMKLCDYVPSNYQTICNSLISGNINSIIKSFENKETPTILCGELGLCLESSESSESLQIAKFEEFSSASTVGCLFCDYFVGQLEKFVEVNATQSEIEYFLDKDCDKYGGGYASECVVYVDQYVPQLVDYLAHNQKPDRACYEIGACQSSSSSSSL
ncbi:hypothetical protein RB653_007267 [Dictyostelium firmibasis]|uniref:Saposin B-type domain-containing protein n=1 Tax=Dictyostelium firmibasis TaxID=79012 RepID=A0AAN7YR30_9MYCE